MSKAALLANTGLALGLLIAYVVLVALHDDASALLGALLGQLAAVGASAGANAINTKTGG